MNYCLYNKDSSSKEEYIDAFCKYLLKSHKEQIISILNESEKSVHYSVTINLLDLLHTSQRLGSLLIAHASDMLSFFDAGILSAQKHVLEETDDPQEMIFKPFCHARLHNLPMCSEIAKPTVSSIRSNDINHFISVPGTVIRTGAVKMLQAEKTFSCTSCQQTFKVKADIEQGNIFIKPTNCGNTNCTGSTFKPVEDSEICKDYQEIKVQDKISSLHLGSIPRSINVILQDDLVDVCKAGDDVVLTGMIIRRWKSMRNGQRCEIEIIMVCNHVIINNASKGNLSVTEEQKNEFEKFWKDHQKDPLKGRNLILKSMCPQIYGLYLVKLSVVLTLIGGVAMYKGNTRIRGESHLLLVGDPGTGKSQFLKYASKLSPRNVLTNGIGTTSAGLTVMAAKDSSGDWTLEAGALVLADGGICCIDEFDSIREHDRTSIHEAMEQQTLSIAKAGLVCKLNCRTTVIAATNPKGKYDLSSSLSINCNIASPLLSRFDLVLVLLDTQDEDWDNKVSSFILREEEEFFIQETKGLFSFEKLQAYICYVKNTFQPKLSDESTKILAKYYQLQRRMSDRIAARTTIRLLESLVRLAQAHARLMFRDEVIEQDAIMAILIVDSSMHASNLLGIYSVLHSSFPDQPDVQYEEHKTKVLEKIGLLEVEITEKGESIDEEFDYNQEEENVNIVEEFDDTKEIILETKEKEVPKEKVNIQDFDSPISKKSTKSNPIEFDDEQIQEKEELKSHESMKSNYSGKSVEIVKSFETDKSYQKQNTPLTRDLFDEDFFNEPFQLELSQKELSQKTSSNQTKEKPIRKSQIVDDDDLFDSMNFDGIEEAEKKIIDSSKIPTFKKSIDEKPKEKSTTPKENKPKLSQPKKLSLVDDDDKKKDNFTQDKFKEHLEARKKEKEATPKEKLTQKEKEDPKEVIRKLTQKEVSKEKEEVVPKLSQKEVPKESKEISKPVNEEVRLTQKKVKFSEKEPEKPLNKKAKLANMILGKKKKEFINFEE